MGSLVKLYHRGNDDKAENVRLTAIFKLTLTADISACAEQAGMEGEEFLYDFIGGGTDYISRKTPPLVGDLAAYSPLSREVIRRPAPVKDRSKSKSGAEFAGNDVELRAPITWEGVFLAKNLLRCVGDVGVKLDVDISSPAGIGNGEAQAGPIAARFGLTYNGAFARFNGGPNAPGSEHWRVTQSLSLGTTPCAGGILQGTVQVNNGLGIPPSYEITFKVTVTSCGVDALELKLDARPRPGIGPGGIPIPPLKEVKDGDPLAYPLKNPPAGNVIVGPDGQAVPKP
ncbi:MAG: hypothetical protein KIT43_06535 [Bauldia sp.]|nr:hypothetical protein [Bauldia sp.]